MINGLENAEFLRFGSIHRNTFINSPLFLNRDLTLKMSENLYMAGQMTGVEGYIESTAMGMIAGMNAAMRLQGGEIPAVPETTAHGALIRHITGSESRHFQPSNIHFGLFPVSDEILRMRDKKQKKKILVDRAINDWDIYLRQSDTL